MHIAYLVDHPQHLPILAAWHQEQWGHLNPGDTLEQRATRMTQHVGKPGIPTTLIAIDGDTVLGSASLVQNDLTSHPHLTPFMASVYVAPEFRRRGVASALVRAVMTATNALAIPRLYLITPDQQRLYASLGWSSVEDLHYRGELVTLMAVDL